MNVLDPLLPVLDAQVAAAQLRVASLQAREKELRALIEGLRNGRHTDLPSTDLARQTGADLKWHRWIDQRIIDLGTELSKVRAAQIEAMDHLRQVFGRQQGLQYVLQTQRQTDRQVRKRRDDYVS